MKKLLLHTCCGPCLSGVHKALSLSDLDLTAYFFNPNIHPQAEFEKRVGAVLEYSSQKNLKMIMNDMYAKHIFESEVLGKPGDRCVNCYRVRLESAAVHAKKNGFDSFSTTLLISPYQKHEKLKAVGEELSIKHSIGFYYRDFRPFYRESQEIAKQMNLYRQRHCGCFISEAQAGVREEKIK